MLLKHDALTLLKILCLYGYRPTMSPFRTVFTAANYQEHTLYHHWLFRRATSRNNFLRLVSPLECLWNRHLHIHTQNLWDSFFFHYDYIWACITILFGFFVVLFSISAAIFILSFFIEFCLASFLLFKVFYQWFSLQPRINNTSKLNYDIDFSFLRWCPFYNQIRLYWLEFLNLQSKTSRFICLNSSFIKLLSSFEHAQLDYCRPKS